MSRLSRKAVIITAASVLIAVAGGLTAFFLMRDNGIAAVVNGVKISEEKVASEIARTTAQYEAQGMMLQPAQLDEVRNSVIDSLVTREVLLQISVDYELEENELDEQIATFRDRFGSDEEFTGALESQGYDLDSFRTVISEDMRIQKMLEDRVPSETEVSDEEILAFYEENPAYFTEPERVHASHILISLEGKETNEEKSAALDKMKSIEKELQSGADFAQLAIDRSEGPSGPNGGDLGEFTRGQMVGAFETAAFALSPGEISGIVETQFGYHIIKVHEKFPESAVPLESVSESISSYLINEKNQSKLSRFLEEMKESADIRTPGKTEPAEAETEI